MKLVVMFCLLNGIVSFQMKSQLNKFSLAIHKQCFCRACRSDAPTFYSLRVQLSNLGKLNYFFTNSFDTLYSLSNYDIQDGIYREKIWTSTQTFEYTYTNGKFEFPEQQLFSEAILDLAKKWDKGTLQTKGGQSTFTHDEPIIAARAILQNGKIKVECFTFNDFR